ncbi:hypothetical protein HNR56_001150 [Roseospira marina]|nr:hypothetical protein [Roseospira marina]MBB5086468.1 hypothetical protein [Roseospira marina]
MRGVDPPKLFDLEPIHVIDLKHEVSQIDHDRL